MITNIIDLAYQIISLIRHQGYDEASKKIKSLTAMISSSNELSSLLKSPEEDFINIFNSMLVSLTDNDYILFADILEESFISYLQKLLSYPNTQKIGDYSLEPSSSGFLTIKHIPKNIYLHSNCNPAEEARRLIDFYFDETYTSYVIYGLGLGYHVKALNDISLGAISIFVYESDSRLIEYVRSNDFLHLFEQTNIKIIYDATGKLFSENISKDKTGILFHYPSILKIDNSNLKLQIKRFYSNWNSFYQWKRMIRINFNKNIINCTENIKTQRSKFTGKNVYIVGGGPSLDSNIELLKSLNKTNSIVLCASTVLKKLINLNMKPDYAIVMDAQERTYGHMLGIEDCTIPLIIDSAAFWKFAQYHCGPKFLALQNGYEPAEDYAKTTDSPLFDTGGTVITLALDIAIKFDAEKIYFIGVDMSFPNAKTHASGLMDEKFINTDNLIRITDVNGKTTYTDELFMGYLQNIENKIASNPAIEYYNLSPFGANIKGCINLN